MGRLWTWARTCVTRHLQIFLAAVVFVSGMVAIWTKFPTHDGSTTLAGALFGSGAAFIGAWVADRNRAASEVNDQARRMEMARLFFTPELARIIANLIWVIGRCVPNFAMASTGQPMPRVEAWPNFRPRRPVLYPVAPQFKDLSEEDAIALIDFYDAVQGVGETVEEWGVANTPQDVNAWNVLMQEVRASLRLGLVAVERFCPERQLSPILPASGALRENIERASTNVQVALDAHLARAAARRPPN